MSASIVSSIAFRSVASRSNSSSWLETGARRERPPSRTASAVLAISPSRASTARLSNAPEIRASGSAMATVQSAPACIISAMSW